MVSGILSGMQKRSINVITEMLILHTFRNQGDKICLGL